MTHYTHFAKVFFTLKMSYNSTVHEQV